MVCIGQTVRENKNPMNDTCLYHLLVKYTINTIFVNSKKRLTGSPPSESIRKLARGNRGIIQRMTLLPSGCIMTLATVSFVEYKRTSPPKELRQKRSMIPRLRSIITLRTTYGASSAD